MDDVVPIFGNLHVMASFLEGPGKLYMPSAGDCNLATAESLRLVLATHEGFHAWGYPYWMIWTLSYKCNQRGGRGL